MEGQALTVEIHDVTPAARDEIFSIRDALGSCGIQRPTLLVIPQYVDACGKAWDLRDHPDMVDWLCAMQRHGAEIVQHGYTHRAPGPPPPGWRNGFMHRWFSRGMAEFAHLTRHQARTRLQAGRRILRACGLCTPGFIAPAWQQSLEALSVLPGLGYRFTAFFSHVVALTGKTRSIHTPALTFDAPHGLVDHAKRLVMRGLEWLAGSGPLLRVALHPGDVHAGRMHHILARIRSLAARRRLVSYEGWLV